jgi:hypothetical protein
MAWCCERFEERIEALGKDGFGIHYSYREPPHNPGRKLFLLVYRNQAEGSEEQLSGAIQIHYCPWCGSDLSSLPRAPNKSSL